MRGVESAKAKIILYKCALYGIALYVLAILQVTFFAKINILSAQPDLLLGAIATLALYEDDKTCALCGIISGFFYCALGGADIPFYILFSFLCAYTLWIIKDYGLPKRHSSFFALAILGFGAKAVFNIAEISLAARNFNLFGAFSSIIIPEFICSLVFSPIPYVFFYMLTRIFYKRNNQRKD
jgi:hypothetical protein